MGRSGGILCRLKSEKLDVSTFKAGRFCLQFVLWDKIKKCHWGHIVVSGAAQDEFKEDLLTELANCCSSIYVMSLYCGWRL